jgi:predicted peptidase
LKILIFLTLLLISFSVKSQIKAFHSAKPYPYLFFTPKEAESEEKLPLVIFLHGRSLSGKDLNKLYRYGSIYAVSKGLHLPAFVVAPQTPMGTSWIPDKVNNLLDDLIEQYPQIDTNRVYVVGMSLGGCGTMHYCGKYWYRVAAGIAMCGCGYERDACNLSKIPFWIMHGKQDKLVPFDGSFRMADAITKCNSFHQLYFDEHETFGHGEYARAFNKPEFYEWLFQNKKNAPSNYILSDRYINIFPKAKTIHFTIPNEPGLYREAEEENVIPIEDSIIKMEESLPNEKPKVTNETKSIPITTKPVKNTSSKNASKSIYVVKNGENLSVIAKKTGVPLSKLKALNGNGIIRPGQKIRLK